MSRTVSYYNVLAAGLLLIALQGMVLYFFGQPVICTCGDIKLWEGVVLSSGNSQHLSDWYTFSHIIHGILFYYILTLLAPRMSVWSRLLIALGIEVTWEITENTPWLIHQYRQQALAQGYMGDSIINSISDSVSQVVGFLLAWKFPVLFSVFLVLALEFYVGFMIRDNLTLNILNFIHHFDFISLWQQGA